MPLPSGSPITTSFLKSLSHLPPPILTLHPRTFIRRLGNTKSVQSIQHPTANPTRWRMAVARNQRRCMSFEAGERRWNSSGRGGNDDRRRWRRKETSRCKGALDASRDVGRNNIADVEEIGAEDGDGGHATKLMTLPTVLTLGRVAAVPLLVSTFYLDTSWSATATTTIFLTAAVTDWLDGYIARKMHLGTAFGAFLDPVADKLMVAATLVMLCTRPLESSIFGQAPWILTVPSIAIIGREITMSAVREWAASQDSKVLEAVAVNNLGKWKTATQMTALTILLATRDASFKGPDGFVASGVILLYISAGLAVWSLAVYMKKIWRVMLK